MSPASPIQITILSSEDEAPAELQEALTSVDALNYDFVEKLDSLEDQKSKTDLLLVGAVKLQTKAELAHLRRRLLDLRKQGVWIGVFGDKTQKQKLLSRMDFAHSYIEIETAEKNSIRNTLRSLVENIRFFSQNFKA